MLNNGMNGGISEATDFLRKSHKEEGKCSTKVNQMPERTPVFPVHKPVTGGKYPVVTAGAAKAAQK